ncbi:MAG: PKD domain-containing protein, partial [Sedimenticolaceae bacterium]
MSFAQIAVINVVVTTIQAKVFESMEKIIPTPYGASRFWTAIAAALLSAAVVARPGDGLGWQGFERPMMGKGHPFTVADLPRGRLRERLESIPWTAREQAMRWLHRFRFPADDLESMEIDDDGAVRYVEPAPILCDEPPCTGAGVPAWAEGPGIDEPEFAAGGSAADDAFLLHSRPGSPNVVFLDFDGLVITGTSWNGATDPLEAKPFDLDGNPGDFSPGERAAIAEIWHRLAEDLAPFDIDVTTEEPASFDRYTGRILITSKKDANGVNMPSSGGGGVAYVGVWGAWNYATRYSPVLVYYDNLAKNTTYIAESAAHEFGHNLGLSHDGGSSSTYYSGHGSGNTSWAPIMGNSFGKNVSQWSKGEYAGANNSQDDIAIIAGELGWAGDDHGDSLDGATPLLIDASGSIQVSTPETDPYNSYPDNKGIIDTADDWDYFSLDAAAGALDITVNPAWEAFPRTSRRGANLDVQAILLDGNGEILASSDPTDDTHASIATTVPAGTFYLAVSGAGSNNYSDYASQGMYFIGGSVTPASDPNDPPVAGFGYGCAGLDCSFSDNSSDGDGTIVARSWSFGDGQGSTATSPGHNYAAAGTYTVTLTVTDDDG